MKGIKYVSESGASGYARAARGYLRGLRKAGVPVTWTPMVVGDRWGSWLEPYQGRDHADAEFGDLCNRPIEYDTVIVHLIPNYFPNWRAEEPSPKLIGMTVWETPRLPDGWPELCSAMDGIVVPCRWNEELFRNGVSQPVGLAPHLPVPPEEADPLEIPGVAQSDFVFYSIAGWFERKGMHLTLESYLRAFTSNDPVVLVLKTGRYDERHRKWGRWWWHVMRHINTVQRDVARIRGRYASPARVAAIAHELSATEIEGLHSRGDCYVSLTRGEGWGLGAYEAAVRAKPVIMTGYGGHLDYLPADLGYHVDFQVIPARPDGAIEAETFTHGHVWADPDIDHGSRLMRGVFENPDDASARGVRLSEHIGEHFVEDEIIRDLLRFIDEVPAR